MNDAAETVLGPYSEAVRAAFLDPRHAGEPSAVIGKRIESRASESEQGVQVGLVAIVSDNSLAALRFRIYGCPHLIAAAQISCERFEGGPVHELADFSVSDLMETLGVPVEKTGRILLLEDAISSLRSQIDARAVNQT